MILPDKIHIAKLVESDRAYASHLFEELTVRLLALKYAYYIHNLNLVKDVAYDASEREWHALGLALDVLKEDETSPCVDFDHNHPRSNEAILLAKRLI